MGEDKLWLVGSLGSEPGRVAYWKNATFDGRLDEAAAPGGVRAVPRLCIKYPRICLKTEENHGKPQSG